MVERERFTVFQRQGFRWAVNVGRWTPQGGSEGEEFKMLRGTEGGSVRTLCNCKPEFKFSYRKFRLSLLPVDEQEAVMQYRALLEPQRFGKSDQSGQRVLDVIFQSNSFVLSTSIYFHVGRELEARSEANIGWPFALFEGLCAGAAVATRSDILLRVLTVF